VQVDDLTIDCSTVEDETSLVYTQLALGLGFLPYDFSTCSVRLACFRLVGSSPCHNVNSLFKKISYKLKSFERLKESA
jgi:hypothetical protein